MPPKRGLLRLNGSPLNVLRARSRLGAEARRAGPLADRRTAATRSASPLADGHPVLRELGLDELQHVMPPTHHTDAAVPPIHRIALASALDRSRVPTIATLFD